MINKLTEHFCNYLHINAIKLYQTLSATLILNNYNLTGLRKQLDRYSK